MRRYDKASFSFKFILLSVAILYVRINPVEQYQASIYRGYPLFWVIISSIILMIIFEVYVFDRDIKLLSVVMLLLSGVSIVILPIMSGYYYYGRGDALTHLGISKDLSAGILSATETFYPALHLSSVILSTVSSSPLNTSLQYTHSATPILFLLACFVMGRIFSKKHSKSIIAFTISAVLLLPTNLVTVTLDPKPSSFAIFYTSFILLVYVLMMINSGGWKYNILIFISMLSYLLMHPQHFFHLMLAIPVIYIISKMRFGMDGHLVISNYMIALLSAISIYWIILHTTVISFFMSTVGYIDQPEGVGSTGDVIALKSMSTTEIILKIFSVDFIYSLILLILLVYYINERNWLGMEIEDRISLNIIVSLFPLGVLLLVFAGIHRSTGVTFRVFGFLMVFASVFSVVAIDKISDFRKIIAVGLSIFVVISMLTVFPSAYTGYESEHVSESQFTGFETTFEYMNYDKQLVRTHVHAFRHYEAIEGRTQSRSGGNSPPMSELFPREENDYIHLPYDMYSGSFNHTFAESVYFTTTSEDKYRHTVIYKENLITSNEFKSIDDHKSVEKMYDSGDYELRIFRKPEGNLE